MERRQVLTALGLGVLGLGGSAVLSGCVGGGGSGAATPPGGIRGMNGAGEPFGNGIGEAVGAATSGPRASATPAPLSTATGAPSASPAPPTSAPTPAPFVPITRLPVPRGTITGLPNNGVAGEQNLLAWTVDDGADDVTVRRYAEFAAATGTRLTFFVNGFYRPWTDHAALLRPLVQSGQVQIANHTWSHQALTKLDDAGIIFQLQKNHDFISETFGVDARPYFRPPFGYHDGRVDRVAASIGYTVPTLWYGSLSDSGRITEDQIMQFANEWFRPQHIVIGHANFVPVANRFDQLRALITERGLRTVTLNDVFGGN